MATQQSPRRPGRARRHLTVAERVRLGKEARSRVPRASHGDWEPAPDRPDPVALLEEQATTRAPDLVPIRHGRMLANPFTFYRGAALIMAADLASTPASGFEVQACGDAHLSNFGLFASPERRLVFDINDFDETLPGPWEWDVKRLVASLEIAARNNGFSKAERRGIVLNAVASYRTSMQQFAGMGDLEVWYLHAHIEEGLPRASAMLDKDSLVQARKVVSKALTRDNRQALGRLTEVRDGRRRFISDPPLVTPIEDLLTPEQAAMSEQVIHDALREARATLPGERRSLLEAYRFAHLARKVVGVGSVGTRAHVLLMLGRDEDDVLILQAKEAQESVLERYYRPSVYKQHGHRVVDGQKRMQATSDVFLCYSRLTKTVDGRTRDFYFRQLRDWKGSWEPESMNPVAMNFFAGICAWTLARAHARTGDRVAIAAYLGSSDSFDRALVRFATSYADQNERDHAALARAVEEGRLQAQTGV